MRRETLGGNYIVLDLGGGRFAFYAHLQPGSLRVKPGDKVKRGQVLGLACNSGNSTEPHLHFHVSNGPDPLASEGLPFVFEDGEIPLQNAEVKFP
ncbi:MAG: M23 family metallopeptidase [Bryobacteraceae bacterium]|nr:M23 family metallopeptidase [Bryobacteraceae bacterium]